jgi:hypothetical protein
MACISYILVFKTPDWIALASILSGIIIAFVGVEGYAKTYLDPGSARRGENGCPEN